LFFKALDRANAIRTAILQSEIIAYEIDADVDDENVIEIFARLNQQGVRLRPSDLAAARLTGHMAGFRNRAREVLSSLELVKFAVPEGKEEKGRSGGLVDTDLLIRASLFLGARLIRYRDVEKQKAPHGQAYQYVEANWEKAVTGFQQAVSFFRGEGIPEGSWLPYRYLLLPPAIASAKGHIFGPKWIAWMILASLWSHYAGETETKLQKDCSFAEKGDIHGLIDHVTSRAKRVESAIPEIEDFTQNIVNQNGVLLALIIHFARTGTRSFPAQKLITSADEPLEEHHIFPRSVIDSYPDRDNEFVPDRLGNITLLTRSDNEHLGDIEPAKYLPTIEEDERKGHCIPDNPTLWNVEQYPEFCRQRETILANTVRDLLAQLTMP